MSSLSISIELPRDVLQALDVSEADAEKRVRELVAIELYREGSISSGKAAEMVGIARGEFLRILTRYHVDPVEETPEELAADVAAVEALLGERRP